MELIAHRGFAAIHAENTIEAFRAATAVADAVEVDVRRSGTDELVAFHDETLDRVASRPGRAAETPLSTLRETTILGSNATIAPLAKVFEVVPENVGLVLDLKAPELIEAVLELGANFAHDLRIAAFVHDELARVREIDPSVETALSVRESIPNRMLRPVIHQLPRWVYWPEHVEAFLERAKAADCSAVQPRYELCLRTNLVERAHAHDLRVTPWTVRSEDVYERLEAVGVDGIIADAPPAQLR